MREQVKDMRNVTPKLLHKVTQRCTYGEEESSVTVLRTQSQQRAPHEENAARNNTNDINVLRSCRWRS